MDLNRVRNLQINITFILVIFFYLICGSDGDPVDQSNPGSSRGFDSGSLMFLTLLTISSLVTLISVLFICGAGGCCGLSKIHWFGRSRTSQEGPMSFENPVALEGGTMMTQLSQIDVRTLELDPIVFEPLPSILDLSPLPINAYNTPSSRGSHGTGNRTNNHSGGLPGVIPFATNAPDIYAHDWFEEPYGNFPRSNLEFIKEIGKGWFGQIMEADAKEIVPYSRKLRVLVKILRNDATQLDQMKFLDESRWYRDSGECGNILKLLGRSIDKLPFLLIMEHCHQGDLKSYLISNVIRAEMLSAQGTLIKMALDIAKGLEWMASSGFIHHDLATRNCQVASEGRIVLGDYGLSTQLFRDDYYWNSNIPIPLRWSAPETLYCTPSTIQTLQVSKLSNIWTFAVVLWEITEFGKLPYFELNDEEVITRVVAEKKYFLRQPTLPYIPMKEELYQIMNRCWNIDPAKRPEMSLIVTELKMLLRKFELDILGNVSSPYISNPAATSTPQEQFDSKWDQLGRNSTNNINSITGKKTVSFSGLFGASSNSEDVVGSGIMDSVENSNISFGSGSNRNVETGRANEGQEGDGYHSLNESGNGFGGSEDDESWLHISKKVMERAHSVQDLMVLTHVDSSDLDPDSLLFIPEMTGTTEELLPSPEKLGNAFIPSYNESQIGQTSCSTSTTSQSQNSNPNYLNAFVTEETGLTNVSTHSSILYDSGSANSEHEKESKQSFKVPISTVNSGSSEKNISDIKSNYSLLYESSPENENEEKEKEEQLLLQQSSSLQSSQNSNDFIYPTISSGLSSFQKAQLFTSSNLLPPPNISIIPATPGTSPNMTNIDINVIQPTPSPGPGESVFKFPNPPQEKEIEEGKTALIPGRKVKFVFSPSKGKKERNGTDQIRRHASTPISSSSPLPHEDMDLTLDEDVFKHVNKDLGNDSLGSGDGINTSGPISPIKFAGERRGISPGELITTVLVGAQDELGLSEYQSVSTQLQDTSLSLDEERRFVGSNGNGRSEELAVKDISAFNSSTLPEILKQKEEATFVLPRYGLTAFLGQASNGATQDEVVNKCEEDEFWSKQIETVRDATNSTKALFELSLRDDDEQDDKESKGNKFVEDIETAQGELGSLVLTDLEDDNPSIQILVPATPSKESPPDQEARMAFMRGGQEQNLSSCSSSSSSTTVVQWDVNNSLDLPKAKGFAEGNLVFNKLFQDNNSSKEETILEDVKFVPSVWNQSLTPVRPALKSPAVIPPAVAIEETIKPGTGMRKSVSFERNATQMVYKYPPPEPLSDSEGDDIFSNNARSRLTTSTLHNFAGTSKAPVPIFPISSELSLDWDLTQEELEHNEINNEESDEEVLPKVDIDPMHLYRISGFEDDPSFHVRGSSEPFSFTPQPSILGQLRHTRDSLKLDLCKGEASLLDDDSGRGSGKNYLSKKSSITTSIPKLDSGVGSSSTSTTVSPFNFPNFDDPPLPNKRNNNNLQETNVNAGNNSSSISTFTQS